MKKVIFLTWLGITLLGCVKNNDCEHPAQCDYSTIVSANQYEDAPSDQLSIDSVSLHGDCLSIFFNSGGCDGDTWEFILIDSEAILKSFPVQRNLRLSLKNEEPCDAVIFREASFDISNLQISDANEIILNISPGSRSISYTY